MVSLSFTSGFDFFSDILAIVDADGSGGGWFIPMVFFFFLLFLEGVNTSFFLFREAEGWKGPWGAGIGAMVG